MVVLCFTQYYICVTINKIYWLSDIIKMYSINYGWSNMKKVFKVMIYVFLVSIFIFQNTIIVSSGYDSIELSRGLFYANKYALKGQEKQSTIKNIINTYNNAKKSHVTADGTRYTTIFANNNDFYRSYENTKNFPNLQFRKGFNWIKNHSTYLIEYREGYGVTTELNQNTIRAMLDKIEHLGYMYHYYSLRIKDSNTTEEQKQESREMKKKCLDRAWKELEVACSAETWYINAFLNTAELTHTVALGYDWFYDGLTDEQRHYLKDNIINKGLLAYCDKDMTLNWRRNIANWNPVCNGGISTAAMLFLDDNETEIDKAKITSEKMISQLGNYEKITVQDLCAAIINQALSSSETLIGIPKWIEILNPEGANLRENLETEIDYMPGTGYLESTGYWIYAMKYFVRFVSSLENTFDSTFNILDNKWIVECLTYPLTVVSNVSKKCFNYGDGGDGGIANCEHLWLANKFARDANYRKYAQASYYYADNYDFTYYTSGVIFYNLENSNFLKLSEDEIKTSLGVNNDFVLKGSKQIGVLRENFNPNANIYASIITGDNTCIEYNGIDGNTHGDTDIGSFVFDAMGIRWIEDLGAEDYSLYNYFKIKTFRWNYYKKRAEAHSTLVINPQEELLVDGNGKKYVNADQYIYADCTFIKSQSKNSGGFLVIDMSDAYNREQNSIKDSNKNSNNVIRGIKITDNRKMIIVQDEIKLEEKGEVYSFINIARGVNIQLSDDKKTAVLTKEDKKVLIKINDNGNTNIKFEIMPKKSIIDFLNEEKNSPDYGTKNSFSANLKIENENKLAIHLENAKTEIINYVIIPVFEEGDINKGAPEISKIENWNIVEKSLSSIKVSTNPTKTTYIQNYEPLDLTGGKITLTYNDSSTELIDLTASEVEVSGFSNSTVGEKTITVTYGGKTTTFKVNVVLQIESEKYEINAEKIKGLTPKTTLEKFLENTTIRRKDYTIKNVRGEEIKAEELIGTGAKLKLNDEELTIVVKADVTGDGTLDVVDLSQLVLHIVEKDRLEGVRLEAADIDEDGDVDIIDLSQMVLVLVDKMKLEE